MIRIFTLFSWFFFFLIFHQKHKEIMLNNTKNKNILYSFAFNINHIFDFEENFQLKYCLNHNSNYNMNK